MDKKSTKLLEKTLSLMCYEDVMVNMDRMQANVKMQFNYSKQILSVIENIDNVFKMMLNESIALEKSFLITELAAKQLDVTSEEWSAMVDDEKREKLQKISAALEEQRALLLQQKEEFVKIEQELLALVGAFKTELGVEPSK